tara:strand:- start:307 stop:1128 length:822 start_codon:yes stop_codon:yes gene_type:complete
MKQQTNSLFLVRPSNFVFNTETAHSNALQQVIHESPKAIYQKVDAEFTGFVQTLEAAGVDVHVFEDTKDPVKPDAVFPNNWISCHEDGTLVLYPMCATNRQLERNPDFIAYIKKHFEVKRVLDLSVYEKENRFLEGTGSIIFDHKSKKAYACISPRTDQALFISTCELLGYQPISFHANDSDGKAIYHTNVMLCIAEHFAAICLESISNEEERMHVIKSLTESGHQIIEISFAQMYHFAGNMLALESNDGRPLLALSQSAFTSLTNDQKDKIE